MPGGPRQCRGWAREAPGPSPGRELPDQDPPTSGLLGQSQRGPEQSQWGPERSQRVHKTVIIDQSWDI